MSFDAAVYAGLIGGAATVIPLYIGIAMIPSQMKINVFLLLGTMMIFKGGMMAYAAGAMTYAAMSIEGALIHVAVYRGIELESQLAAWGLLFGFVQWIVVGMGLGMMRFTHSLIRSGEMNGPGPFALNFPAMTVVGFFMLHLLYGVLVGTFYEVFI